MENNDILIRLRYALDIKDVDMVNIFQLGGIAVTTEDVKRILMKEESQTEGSNEENENKVQPEKGQERIPCDNSMFDSFLNGLVIYKRGKREEQETTPEQILAISTIKNVNNVALKKIKIALTLSSEDMIEIFKEGGAILSNGELSALFRKEGHRNYRECSDKYMRNFLKGLAIKYRGSTQKPKTGVFITKNKEGQNRTRANGNSRNGNSRNGNSRNGNSRNGNSRNEYSRNKTGGSFKSYEK